jgi:hypothetical protein
MQGKRADLILVDGDPTKDIADLRKVAGREGRQDHYPSEIDEALGVEAVRAAGRGEWGTYLPGRSSLAGERSRGAVPQVLSGQRAMTPAARLPLRAPRLLLVPVLDFRAGRFRCAGARVFDPECSAVCESSDFDVPKGAPFILAMVAMPVRRAPDRHFFAAGLALTSTGPRYRPVASTVMIACDGGLPSGAHLGDLRSFTGRFDDREHRRVIAAFVQVPTASGATRSARRTGTAEGVRIMAGPPHAEAMPILVRVVQRARESIRL